MATARKCGPSACNSSTISAELCWLMWLTMTAGPSPQARQWICPAKVLASPRSIGRVTLFELYVGRLDDGGPFDGFRGQEGFQLLRRAGAHHAADRAVGLGNLLGLERRGRRLEDLLACLGRRRTGRDQRVPVV